MHFSHCVLCVSGILYLAGLFNGISALAPPVMFLFILSRDDHLVVSTITKARRPVTCLKRERKKRRKFTGACSIAICMDHIFGDIMCRYCRTGGAVHMKRARTSYEKSTVMLSSPYGGKFALSNPLATAWPTAW